MNSWISSRPSSRAVTPPTQSHPTSAEDRLLLEPKEATIVEENGHTISVDVDVTNVSSDPATEGKVHHTPTPPGAVEQVEMTDSSGWDS